MAINAPLMVQPNTFQAIRYVSPRNGKLEIKINCTGALDVFVVQASDMNRWKTGKDFKGTFFRHRKDLHFKMKIDRDDFDDEWYLVFDNVSEDPIGVNYEVFV